ncbi:MAG TPA: SURF1 family protein [Propionibacteriaceae bacterium]|nr:SURF1 family protein [Propionibacteriaceae bacterium]
MTRLRQVLIIALGLLAATVMTWLGLWQLNVYRAQGEAVAARRAAEPPVALTSVAPAGAIVRDGYGRSVRFDGVYLGQHQMLLPAEDRPNVYRVVTPLRQADGSVIAVVRGLDSAEAGEPPAGKVSQMGVLLPSEQSPGEPATELTAVQVPVLAQRWPGPLVDGYVILSAADASEQGLEPAEANLPTGRGRLRNGAYALQWWVFAAFAVGMAIRMARDQGRQVGSDDQGRQVHDGDQQADDIETASRTSPT